MITNKIMYFFILLFKIKSYTHVQECVFAILLYSDLHLLIEFSVCSLEKKKKKRTQREITARLHRSQRPKSRGWFHCRCLQGFTLHYTGRELCSSSLSTCIRTTPFPAVCTIFPSPHTKLSLSLLNRNIRYVFSRRLH